MVLRGMHRCIVMVVEALKSWLPEQLESEVEDIVMQLRGFSGHRTLWLDNDNSLWHAEPDEMLEELGHRYVGTFFQPDADVVAEALAKMVPVRRPARVRSVLPEASFARVPALVPA